MGLLEHPPSTRGVRWAFAAAVLAVLVAGLVVARRARARQGRGSLAPTAAANHRPRPVARLSRAIEALTTALARRDGPDLTWVADDLAIGGRILAREWAGLVEAGLGAVVDCRAEDRDPAEVLAGLGVDFLHLPTPDSGDFTADQVAAGVAWVEERLAGGKRVLVHCRAGKGRSVLIAAAVLSRRGVSPDDALALIRSRRPIVTPTPGQIARLRAFAAPVFALQAAEQTVEIPVRSDNQISGD